MSDGYRRQRDSFGNYGGSLLVTPFVTSTTLVPIKPAGSSLNGTYTIYLQRIHIHVAGGLAGVTWTIQDSNSNAITGAVSASTSVMGTEFDFGPHGVALSAGADLQFVASAPGASGTVSWDAYQKLTSATGFGGS